MTKRKFIVSITFFLTILFATLYIIFSKNNIHSIIDAINSISIKYVIIGMILVILYFFMQGIYMKLLLKTLSVKISVLKGMYYSIVEFFFSAITPSSTGGQPVQLYYMTKDKISKSKSLIVLILNSIAFKLFLVVFGFIILICDKGLVFNNGNYTCLLFMLGMIVDIIIIIICYLLMFNGPLIEKIIRLFYKISNKVRHKNIDYEEKIKTVFSKYKNNADYIKQHRLVVFVGIIITFIQRMLMFSITFVVYIALGFKGISYFHLLLLQTFTQIAIEGLPLPGGTGALEMIITNVYISIFGSLNVAGTLLTRTLSFYLPLLIIMIIIIFVTKFKYSNNNIKE